MANIDQASVAAEIRAHLGRAGETRTWLARQIGMQQSGLSRRLTGESSFTLDELIKIADALGVSVTALIPEQVAS